MKACWTENNTAKISHLQLCLRPFRYSFSATLWRLGSLSLLVAFIRLLKLGIEIQTSSPLFGCTRRRGEEDGQGRGLFQCGLHGRNAR